MDEDDDGIIIELDPDDITDKVLDNLAKKVQHAVGHLNMKDAEKCAGISIRKGGINVCFKKCERCGEECLFLRRLRVYGEYASTFDVVCKKCYNRAMNIPSRQMKKGAPMVTTSLTMTNCPACHAPLKNAYCSSCGTRWMPWNLDVKITKMPARDNHNEQNKKNVK